LARAGCQPSRQEVINDHYRVLEKEEGDDFELRIATDELHRAWVTTMELDVHPNPSLEAPAPQSDVRF